VITEEYLHSYVDRRMEQLIAEWNLSRRSDLGDMSKRIQRLGIRDTVISGAKRKRVAARLAAIETRLLRIQGAMKR